MIYILVHRQDFINDYESKSISKETFIGDYRILLFREADIPKELNDYKRYSKEDMLPIRSNIEQGIPIVVKKSSPNKSEPFSAKVVDGFKIFTRNHGIKHNCSIGNNEIYFTVPYPRAKITGIDVVWGEEGDSVSFFVLDSTDGIITGVPNYTLNQFAFNTNVTRGFHREESKYDADLYGGLQLKMIYNSMAQKTVGFNIKLHELK